LADTPPLTSKPSRWRRWALEGLLLVAVIAAFHFWQTRNAPRGQAPFFAGKTTTGEDFDLNQWRQQHPDQAGLIYFWSEWCGICRTTAGTVANIADDWPVITVSMQSGPSSKVSETMRQRHYTWPTLADPDADIFRQYTFRAVPAFVIIDKNGEIRSVSMGYTSEIGLRLRLWWATQTAT
jgi:thiol-disulfide isomerase/thioredoxin